MTGTEDAQPARDVAEALAWFRENYTVDRLGFTPLGPEDDAIRFKHAATIVRAALAAGPDERSSEERREEIARLLHDANTGRITPDETDSADYAEMAQAVLDWVAGARPAAEPPARATLFVPHDRVRAVWASEILGTVESMDGPSNRLSVLWDGDTAAVAVHPTGVELVELARPAAEPDERRRLAGELRSRFPDGPGDAWSAGWLSAAGYLFGGGDLPGVTDIDIPAAAARPAGDATTAAGPRAGDTGSAVTLPLDELFWIKDWADDRASWRCLLGKSTLDEGYTSGACRYDHNCDTRAQAHAEAREHLRVWHRLADRAGGTAPDDATAGVLLGRLSIAEHRAEVAEDELNRLRSEVAALRGAVGKEAEAKADAVEIAEVWKMRHDRLRDAGNTLAKAAAAHVAYTSTDSGRGRLRDELLGHVRAWGDAWRSAAGTPTTDREDRA